MSQFQLLQQRRFGPFFATQFLGAFNDNLFKNALVVLVTFGIVNHSAADTDTLVNLAALLFIAPFFLFSATAGQLADKYEKSMLMRRIKLAEVGIMLIAAIGFLFSSVGFLIVILFLMGTQSAFFGPVKYAILPQHLKEQELVGGNGLVEMGTFLAILLGTILAPIAQSLGAGIIATILVVVAVVGWLTSREIPPAPAVDPSLTINLNVFTETRNIVRTAQENRTVFLSILGISWFWFYGATLITQMPNYAKEVLGGSPQVFTLLVATFSIGIGLGSLLCERMSGKMIEIGLVPFGAIGLTVFALDLSLITPPGPTTELRSATVFLASGASWRVLIDLGLMALFGGFYIVPLYALIQHRSPESHRSRIIAANNILNALFMVVAAMVAIGLLGAGLSIPNLFLVLAIMNAAVAWFIFRLVPEFLMRFIVWMLVHTIYRLTTVDMHHVPNRGPALIACNHVSFVDALVLTAGCRRPIRFIMYHGIFKLPVLNFVFRTTRAIPIAPKKENEALMEKAFDEVSAGLAAGEVIGIFPEGTITHDGEMNEFRPGIQRILARNPVPVVPVALRGLWGSFFSRKGGGAMGRPLRLITGLGSRIEVAAAEPIPPSEVEPHALYETVLQLRGERK